MQTAHWHPYWDIKGHWNTLYTAYNILDTWGGTVTHRAVCPGVFVPLSVENHFTRLYFGRQLISRKYCWSYQILGTKSHTVSLIVWLDVSLITQMQLVHIKIVASTGTTQKQWWLRYEWSEFLKYRNHHFGVFCALTSEHNLIEFALQKLAVWQNSSLKRPLQIVKT